MNIKNKIKQVIVVRRDLKMRRGKESSQCSHSAMKFLVDEIRKNYIKDLNKVVIELTPEQVEWIIGGKFTKIVLVANNEKELNDLITQAKENGVPVFPIVDEGLTEFNHVPTLTSAAFGPYHSEDLDKITGHLDLR